MASQQEYSYVANHLVAFAHQWIRQLQPWQQGFIPMDKIPAAAGATAKEAVDALDEFRANHPPPAAAKFKRNKGRRK